jgi:hypothetical protein
MVDPADSFSQVEYHTWQPAPYAGFRYHLPVPLSQTWNESVTSGLTNAQRFFLSQNGFVIVHSQEAQFSVIRQRVAQAFGQPYFLTTDAAYHALNLSSQALLEALEKGLNQQEVMNKAVETLLKLNQ